MRLSYDLDTDAAFIYLDDSIDEGGVSRNEVCDVDLLGAAIVLDFDNADHLVGIEIMGASKILPPKVLQVS